jgi:hypothetical protein
VVEKEDFLVDGDELDVIQTLEYNNTRFFGKEIVHDGFECWVLVEDGGPYGPCDRGFDETLGRDACFDVEFFEHF